MDIRWKILSLLVGVITLIISFLTVRKRKLSEHLALFWIVLSCFMIFLALKINLIEKVSDWLGIIDANNLILLLAIAFLVFISFYFSIEISRLEKQFIILAQENALLKKEKVEK